MKADVLKLRYSRWLWVVTCGVMAAMVAAHAVVISIPYLIPWLISLNEVVPNATSADQMSEEQLALLSFEYPTAQWQVADIAGSSTGLVGMVTALVVLVAALSVTGEYRYDSISLTVQLEPRRHKVLASKLLAVTALVSVVSVFMMVISGVALWIGSSVADAPLTMSLGELAGAWLRSWVALVLMGVIGMCAGVLLRGQLLTIGVLVGVAVLESLLRPVSVLVFGGPSVLSVLPFGLSRDITGHASILTGQFEGGFPVPVALGLLFAWALVMVALATVVFNRRDVAQQA